MKILIMTMITMKKIITSMKMTKKKEVIVTIMI